ncbi:MAG TPA: hypothetical protein DCL77_18165 [Prolixibacteraceae bacterium]|jgi:prenyltransferase beta subunit|nr:hypothetical protein [Prolixibacteraceae bacterium]
MISLLSNAIALLDDQGREEVLQFLLSNQNTDGGFRDRGGRSDLYYSLFGMLMLKGAGGKEQGAWIKESNPKLVDEAILKLKQFIDSQTTSTVPGFIERCCLVLLQKELKSHRVSRIQTLWSLGRSFMKERHSINLSYRSFVLFLTLEAVFPFPFLFKVLSKRMLAQTSLDSHSPCSEIAAKVFLLKMLNQDGSKEQELLVSFSCKTGGFKAFSHLGHADMLSTAVALFALIYSEYDIRLFKPSCLSFIQQNYFEGAFLSGDGDPTADVEYTFYGLLALGEL